MECVRIYDIRFTIYDLRAGPRTEGRVSYAKRLGVRAPLRRFEMEFPCHSRLEMIVKARKSYIVYRISEAAQQRAHSMTLSRSPSRLVIPPPVNPLFPP